jgi:hypothetical protein
VTDLERFAAVLLAEWQAESGRLDAPLAVGSLLDRTLSYKQARRLLKLETSEDYELLVLRLLAGEGGLAVSEPGEAGDIARTVVAAKVPDLDVLQRLRSATMTFTDEAVGRLEGVRPLPSSGPDEPPPGGPVAGRSSGEPDRVFPIRRPPEPAASTATPTPRGDPGPPPEFLTGVAFTPPGGTCWGCGSGLPAGRTVNFCVECGADQRTPQCASCGAAVERQWKHCPECGLVLARS